MAGLDDNGLTIKRLPDIISELEAALKLQYGNDVDLTENSLLGILNTIYAASVAENWELAQALYNAFNIDTATGKQLDDLAYLSKITRLQPTKSYGGLDLFGSSGTIVPVGTEFSDLSGNRYLSTTEGNLSSGTSRTPIVIGTTNGSGSVGEPSITYNITINGDLYSRQFIWPDVDLQTVSDTMSNLIGDKTDYKAESYTVGNTEFVTESIPVSGGTVSTGLNIINKDSATPITISVSVIQSPDPLHYEFHQGGIVKGTEINTFSDSVLVESVNSGDIVTSIHTLVNIETPVTGLISVDNPSSMITGRGLESDEELRQRFKDSGSLNSSATTPSTQAKLKQLTGVTKAIVTENPLPTVDADGRPPFSYDCLVVGGIDQEIAESIWNNKPSSVRLYGNTSLDIIDDEGETRKVFFSRPVEVYIWVKVEYSKYDEEAFPDDGESLIKSSVLEYGNNLRLGEDIITTRFFGSIYGSVGGIGNLTIKVAKGDPSIEPSAGEFSTNTLDINSDEDSIFSLSRIEVIEV